MSYKDKLNNALFQDDVFYHGTVAERVPSILQHGLDPSKMNPYEPHPPK